MTQPFTESDAAYQDNEPVSSLNGTEQRKTPCQDCDHATTTLDTETLKAITDRLDTQTQVLVSTHNALSYIAGFIQNMIANPPGGMAGMMLRKMTQGQETP